MPPLSRAVVTVALAGFLFGFDTIVISGADRPIQALWNTSDWFHGTFIMSMALWGTVVGALGGGWPCDRFGRRTTLFWIGVLYLVSAVGSALATDPYVFSAFRFLGGLGVGASSVAAPIYISEIAPAEKRGRLVAAYQFNIVLGILVAFFSNYLIGAAVEVGAWRWMLGVEALPAAVYCALVLAVPESPRWLVLNRGDEATARQVLTKVEPTVDLDAKLAAIRASATAVKEQLFSGRYTRPISLAVLIAFFNQVSGINFVLYYAPRIFEAAGIDQSNTLLASIPIGVVNIAFTFLGLSLIDRMGRRRLMTIGSMGYIVTLVGIALCFYFGAEGWLVVALVAAFVGAHAVGQGTVIWVFISEIFPNGVRAAGMSLGSGTHWVMAAVITMVTPAVLAAFSPAVLFAAFAAAMAVQLWWVRARMPETRGVSLEGVEATQRRGARRR